jgi:transcriptional regulator with XRE-family HTH domain
MEATVFKGATKEMRAGDRKTVLVDTFANNLRRARVKAGLSQSELAKKIWGTIRTPDGYLAARKRDRISSYEKGNSHPTPEGVAEIAKALGIDPTELESGLANDAAFKENEAISMTMLTDKPGRVHLKVNVLTRLDLASKIIAMLNGDVKK